MEQRYVVLGVIRDGFSVTDMANCVIGGGLN
jgi:hypothetical protein